MTDRARMTWFGALLLAALGAAALVLSVAPAAAQEAVPVGESSLTAPLGRLDAESATGAFRDANRLYSEERYVEAAALYEKIVDAGFANADVLYNLGNAHYKAGELGQAVLAYERALKLRPSHADASENLAFVGELLADRRVPVGGPVSEFLGRLSARFTVDRLAVLTSVLYFVLFAALVVGVLRFGIAGWLSGWLGRVVIVLAVCVIVSGGLLVYRVALARGDIEAVVLAPEVSVRTGPGEDFVLEFRLHEGTKVRLEESREEWGRVSVPGTDLNGWLPESAIERI